MAVPNLPMAEAGAGAPGGDPALMSRGLAEMSDDELKAAYQQSLSPLAGMSDDDLRKGYAKSLRDAAVPMSGVGWDDYIAQAPLGRVLDAFGQGAKEGWGAGNFGLSPEVEDALKKAGIFNDVEKGQHDLIRAFNEGLLRPAGAALDAAYHVGAALFRGYQGAAEQIGREVGAPELGRDIAALPEAFPTGVRGGGIVRPAAREAGAFAAQRATAGATSLPLPEAPPPPEAPIGYGTQFNVTGTPPITVPVPSLDEAASWRVIGAGEDGWKGLTEPKAAPESVTRDAVEEAKEAPPESAVAPEPTAPRDVHEAARQIAPDVFQEYDSLAAQRDLLRSRLSEAQTQVRAQAEAQAPHAAEIADLERRLQDTTPRLAKKYEARLEELRPEHDAFLADEEKMGPLLADTPQMAAWRRLLQETDYQMRDLSPQVTAAYREAARQFPEPEPEPVVPEGAVVLPSEAPVAVEEPAAPEVVPETEVATAPSEPPQPAVAPEPEPAAPAPREPVNIAADVAAKMVAAGRPQEEANAAGALLQAYFETRADRFNGARGTAAEMYEAEGPDIRGAERGGRRGAAAGKTRIPEMAQTGRGGTKFAARPVMTLFAKADASTFIHETGHIWLEDLMRDALDARAPVDLAADAQTVRKWLGAKEGEPIATAQHEKFARGFERYMMEGIAPSQTLARVFAQFQEWLTKIYQTVARLKAPITDDIRDVFDRLLTRKPEPPIVVPETETMAHERAEPRVASPFQRVPREPERLINFLRRDFTIGREGDVNSTRRAGGIKDVGGDLKAIIGGTKGRPGLINNASGMTLDEAAQRAQEAGYFPEHGGGRPSINDLLDAIAEDHRGNARYSEFDLDQVNAYHNAVAHNAEIDRLATVHEIDPKGMTREQFFDAVAQKATERELADAIENAEDAHQKEFDEAEAEARAEDPSMFGEPRSLEDLENAYRQETASGAVGQGAPDNGQPGPSGGRAGDSEAGAGSRGGGAGPTGREGQEGGATGGGATSARRPAEPTGPNERYGSPGTDLLDKAGNIRLDNLNTPEDVNKVIREAAEQNNDFLEARRGVVSDAQVLDLADALGMDVARLKVRQIGEAFNAEQVVAARKLLIQSATNVRDLMAKAAEGTDADVMAYAEAKARHVMIQEQVSGITAEAGRALRAFRALEGQEQAQAVGDFLKNATGRTLFQLRQEAALGAQLETPGQVSRFVHDAEATPWERTKAGIIGYFVNNLISGPITHGAYSVGNTVMALWKAVPETLMQATSGAVREAFTGEATDRVRYGEAGAQLYGMVRGLRDGIVPAWKAVQTGVFVPLGEAQRDLGFGPASRPQSIPGPVGYVVETPSRVVTAIHTLFYTMNYEQEIARQAYRDAAGRGLRGAEFDQAVARLTQSPTQEMMTTAHDEAMRMVLMRSPQFGSARYNLSQIVNNNLPAKIIMPFLNIGMNILQEGLVERTPLAVLSSEARAELMGSRGAAVRDLRIGKIAAGSALAAASVGMAVEGLITGGGPVDPNVRRVMEDSGWKAYSLKVGDTYVPYRKYLGPLGPLVSASADIYEVGHLLHDEGLTKAAAAIGFGFSEVVADETWMAGLSNFIDAARHWDTKGERYLRSLAFSFVPFSSLLRQTSRLVDPYQREARTVLDTVRANTPFLSESLPPQIGIWGQPIDSHMMISPSTERRDPVDQRLIALDVGVTKMERKVRGVELTDQQYNELAQTAGRLAKTRLDTLIASPGFSAMPEGVQRSTIRETISDSREAARNMLMMHHPEIIQKAVDAKRAQLQSAH